MGSSGDGEVDCSAGTIVWVRRRNGSWWPGKILGPEELASSHLMSPRSGTPVKLLGREDASVDWYNLEKSKRVKAFRCGDFDDCIGKAEASLGMPSRKREKYARREDAIIHALELEKQMLGTNHERLGDIQRGVTCRAKRSKFVYLPESSEISGRKESSPTQKMSVSETATHNCHLHPGSLTGKSSSQSREDDLDSSATEYSESDTEEETLVALDNARLVEAEHKSRVRSQEEVEHASTSSVEHAEREGNMSHRHPHNAVSGGGSMYEWQLKGKRNIRSFTKRSVDSFDGRVSDGSSHGAFLEEKRRCSGKRGTADSLHLYPRSYYDFGSGLDEPFMLEPDISTHALGFSRGGYSPTSRSVSQRWGGIYHNLGDGDELAWEGPTALRKYWEQKREHLDPSFTGRRHVGGRVKPMLIDVDLRVQATLQKEHVPIVSLMSRLNGKAIIGHPIQIEALKEGSSEGLFPRADGFSNEPIDNDVNTALTPVWRTARRTANRVRRLHPSSTWDGEDAAGQVPFDKGKKQRLQISNTGSKQKYSHDKTETPRPPTQRKAKRKAPKKASSSSNKKTRTLSSIAVEQRAGNKSRRNSSSLFMDDLIKPVSGPTTVACIPVKLVFSRLFEGVLRPPARAAGHGDTTNGGMGRSLS